jgi:tRNA pseudouridine13 synthase
MPGDIAHDPLPFLTADLAGCGGEIKSSPEHFVVEELPLYAAAGAGEHVYLRLRRSGWSTRDLARRLGQLAGLSERDVGYAGLKDKQACATQSFSLALRGDERELARRVAGELGVEVLDVARHANKLRRGHLLGNRFEIVLALPPADVALALERARPIAQRLQATGLANFYGTQRLGAHGEHARRGRRDLGAARRTFASRFALNAYQAQLFNDWLVLRLERGWFERVLTGDVAKKVDNGALFDVLDEELERERALRREIVATGPIYGASMRTASGEPGALEREVLEASGTSLEDFARARLAGTRRAARAFIAALELAACDAGLRLCFALPKGSYATVVLREFTRAPEAGTELDEPEG